MLLELEKESKRLQRCIGAERFAYFTTTERAWKQWECWALKAPQADLVHHCRLCLEVQGRLVFWETCGFLIPSHGNIALLLCMKFLIHI